MLLFSSIFANTLITGILFWTLHTHERRLYGVQIVQEYIPRRVFIYSGMLCSQWRSDDLSPPPPTPTEGLRVPLK